MFCDLETFAKKPVDLQKETIPQIFHQEIKTYHLPKPQKSLFKHFPSHFYSAMFFGCSAA